MNTKTTLPVITLFLSALFFAACLPTNQPENTPAVNSEAVMQQPTSDSDSMLETTSDSLADKIVSVETAYMSPAGEEKVAFMVYVDANGVVTNAETGVMAKSPISVTRQESFAQELPTAIVGMKLSELNSIDRVGGSSLTTGAFNEALVELKAQL